MNSLVRHADVKNTDLPITLESGPYIQCEHKSEKKEVGEGTKKMASREQTVGVCLRMSSVFLANKYSPQRPQAQSVGEYHGAYCSSSIVLGKKRFWRESF